MPRVYWIVHKGRHVGDLLYYKTLTGAMAGRRAWIRHNRPKNGRVKIFTDFINERS